MPHIDAVVVRTSEPSDEAALARLGAAAVLLWDRIEPETRSHSLSLAPLVAGITNAGDCSAVLARLIRDSQTRPTSQLCVRTAEGALGIRLVPVLRMQPHVKRSPRALCMTAPTLASSVIFSSALFARNARTGPVRPSWGSRLQSVR